MRYWPLDPPLPITERKVRLFTRYLTVLWIAVVGVACAEVDVADKRFACQSDDDCDADYACLVEPGLSSRICKLVTSNFGPDLVLMLKNMSAHVGQRTEVRIVSGSGFLRAKAILDPLDAPEAKIEMPGAVPAIGLPYTLQAYADLNNSGDYTPPSADHAWERELTSATYEFAHDTLFVDLEEPKPIGGDFVLHVTGMDKFHKNALFEVRVREMATGATVGMYRLAKIPDAADFKVLIPGVIDASSVYEVDFYADVNGNKEYDTIPTDHAWRIKQEATPDAELVLEWEHTPDFVDIQF